MAVKNQKKLAFLKVKALLIENDISQREIAADLRVSPGYISAVLGGHYLGRAVRDHIAKRLEIDYEKLWGKAA
jgi:transcriptional regulator with XRE-family HTH domain